MFQFLKKLDTKVLVLYKFVDSESFSRNEFDTYIDIMSNFFNIKESYLSYYDIYFNEKNPNRFDINYKLACKNVEKLASFIIYDIKPTNAVPNYQIHIGKSLHPSILFFQFNYKLDINKIYPLIISFNPIYGFIYDTIKHPRACSYALLGYSSDLPKIQGIGRFELDKEKYLSNKANFKFGKIRDVYKVNILTNVQLNFIVYKLSLKEFIEKNKLGAISKITDTIYRWELDDSILPTARQMLYASDIMI